MDRGTAEFFAYVTILFGLVTTVIWLRIGWRAMRAHERIADAVEHGALPPWRR